MALRGEPVEPRRRIVCTKRAIIADPTPHPHIVGVGTGERHDWADMRWRLDQVLAAMEEGDVFYTQSAGGDTAEIETYVCPRCGDVYIFLREDGGSNQTEN